MFNALKDFGLIAVDGSKPVVFRRSSLGARFKPIRGLPVKFRLSGADKKRPVAVDVLPVD
jgi:hypothetical protein